MNTTTLLYFFYGYLIISMIAWVGIMGYMYVDQYVVKSPPDHKFGHAFNKGIPRVHTLIVSAMALPFINLWWLYVVIRYIPYDREFKREARLGRGKYLFLDIDGVINTKKTYFGFNTIPRVSDKNAWRYFDNSALALLNNLVEVHGVKIILSSTWRKQGDRELESIARQIGIPLHDKTPVLESGLRGREIHQWFVDNEIDPKTVAYLILDDETDGMTIKQRQHLIKTKFDEGLTCEDFERIVKYFSILES